MKSIIRSLRVTTLSPVLKSFTFLARRTYYTQEHLGIVAFRTNTAKFSRINSADSELAKANIEKALSDPGGVILKKEIFVLLYTAKSDRELDFLLKAIQKYDTQSGVLGDLKFHFGSALMQLFYVQNKTDKALELYLSKEKNIFQTARVAILLMNKLYEEKRYNDVVRVFDKFESSIYVEKEGGFIEMENILDALYQLNTPESFHRAKELIKKFSTTVPWRLTVKLILLAIKQNEPAFALEALDYEKYKWNIKILNIKIIALCKLDRIEEATASAQFLQLNPAYFTFYSETINALKQSLDKASSGEIKKQLQAAIEFGNSHLKEETLEESILKNWGLKLNESDRKDGSNSNKKAIDDNQDNGANKDSSPKNQQKRFPSRQLDQQKSGDNQQNRFQPRKSDKKNGVGYQQNVIQPRQEEQHDGGSLKQNKIQSRQVDQNNSIGYQQKIIQPRQIDSNNGISRQLDQQKIGDYQQNRFPPRQLDQKHDKSYQQNRIQPRQVDQSNSKSYQQNMIQSKQVDQNSYQQKCLQQNQGSQQHSELDRTEEVVAVTQLLQRMHLQQLFNIEMINALKQSLDKATSGEIKKQLQAAIEFEYSHLKKKP